MKTMNFIFSLILLFLLPNCSNTNRPPKEITTSSGIVSTEERNRYNFINFLINTTDRINFTKIEYVLDQDFENFYVSFDQTQFLKEITSGDSIFRATDSQYVKRQINESKTFRIAQQLIKDRKVIPKEKLDSFRKMSHKDFWRHLHEKFKIDKFMIIAMPIFSKDHKTCMVMIEFEEYYGGGGALLVFKKGDITWTLTHQLRFWDI